MPLNGDDLDPMVQAIFSVSHALKFLGQGDTFNGAQFGPVVEAGTRIREGLNNVATQLSRIADVMERRA